MRYTFKHSILFKSGRETAPYRSTRWWRTPQGALKAGEQQALLCDKYYDNVLQHSIVVIDDTGKFITNMAA